MSKRPWEDKEYYKKKQKPRRVDYSSGEYVFYAIALMLFALALMTSGG